MADFRYFATHKGKLVQLQNVGHSGGVGTKAKDFMGFTPEGTKIAAERKIEYSSNPSRHACGPKCREAKGFKCECACGGKYHGCGEAAFKAQAIEN